MTEIVMQTLPSNRFPQNNMRLSCFKWGARHALLHWDVAPKQVALLVPHRAKRPAQLALAVPTPATSQHWSQAFAPLCRLCQPGPTELL